MSVGVVGGGQLVSMGYSGCMDERRGAEPSICVKHLKKQRFNRQKSQDFGCSERSTGGLLSPAALVGYLSCQPIRALADVGHPETKTVGASEGISGQQVVEAGFTHVTVSSHHVDLVTETDGFTG